MPAPLPDFSDILAEIPDVTWLWPGWLPMGAITLLGAAAGTGKSYLALDLTYRVITGTPFPGDPSDAVRPPAPVLYVDAERCEQMLKSRVLAWPDRPRGLYVLEPPLNDIFDLARQEYRDNLIEAVTTHAPRLVIVDSLSGISSRGENSIEDVRQIMAFLTALAADFGCAVLLLHHLRKLLLGSFRDELTQDDFRGSTHLTAAPRCVLGLTLVQTGAEVNRNGPRKLEVVKTNFAQYPEPLGVEFVPLAAGGVELKYGPVPDRYREPTQIDECVTWLRATLAASGEPMRPRELIQLARNEGYSRDMLYRARRALAREIKDTASPQNPGNMWSLVELSDCLTV